MGWGPRLNKTRKINKLSTSVRHPLLPHDSCSMTCSHPFPPRATVPQTVSRKSTLPSLSLVWQQQVRELRQCSIDAHLCFSNNPFQTSIKRSLEDLFSAGPPPRAIGTGSAAGWGPASCSLSLSRAHRWTDSLLSLIPHPTSAMLDLWVLGIKARVSGLR